MISSKIILFLGLCLLFSPKLKAQLKYVNNNKGVTEITASYSKIDSTNTFGGQISFTRDGNFGFGLFYSNSNTLNLNSIGLQGEYAIYRPVNSFMLGANLLGAVGLSFYSIKREVSVYVANGISRYQTVESSFMGQIWAIGAEVYLHSPGDEFKIEPFLQFLRTFYKMTDNDISETTAQNSFAIGVDVFILNYVHNNLLLSAGEIVQEGVNNSFSMDVSFVHSFN